MCIVFKKKGELISFKVKVQVFVYEQIIKLISFPSYCHVIRLQFSDNVVFE